MSLPAIPRVTDDPQTHRLAIERLSQCVDILAGRRGTLEQRALTVQDLITVGHLRVGPDLKTLYNPNRAGAAAFNEGSTGATADSVRGYVFGLSAVASGVDIVTVTGLGLSAVPTQIATPPLMMPTTSGVGSFRITSHPIIDTFTADEFTTSLSGVTDTTGYILLYLIKI